MKVIGLIPCYCYWTGVSRCGFNYCEKGGDVLCLGMEGYGMKWDDGNESSQVNSYYYI